MREVKINKVMNGFVVVVGCQILVFQEKDELLRELGRYLADPEAVEKEYLVRFGRKFDAPCTPTQERVEVGRAGNYRDVGCPLPTLPNDVPHTGWLDPPNLLLNPTSQANYAGEHAGPTGRL